MKPIALTKDTFDGTTAEGLTVVDFWASWCGPCKMQAPILDELADELTDVKFAKVNVDEEQQLAIRFRVDAIPTLCFIRDGRLVNQVVGLTTKDRLKAMINISKA